MEKISVLLADDHRLIRQCWNMTLSKESCFHICGEAGDGEDVISQAKLKRPNVVLMDIHLGQLDGFESTKLIRKYSPSSKILGISGGIFPAYARKIISCGGHGYITKNSSFEELKKGLLEVHAGNIFICAEIRELLNQQASVSNEESRQKNLTKREMEIVALIRHGLTSKQMARQLNLSIKTIDIHRSHIMHKLQFKNVAALIIFGIQNGL